MLLWYSSLFKHVASWCLGTAIAQFVVFLFIFLGVSYLSTLLEIDYSNEIISNYEKYIVLASSLYMIVPFTFSTVFLFGLFNKNPAILKIFMIESLVTCAVILIVVIGSGIFLAIKETDYVAYSLIGVGIILELFLIHGILLVYGLRNNYTRKQQNFENRSSISSENMQEPYVCHN